MSSPPITVPFPGEGHRLSLQTPAKVNLILKVTGRRPDGYHSLESLFCGIDLFDTLLLKFGGTGLSVRCSDPAIPEDGRNLALRAAHSFFQAAPQAAGRGLHIEIEKRIPVGAGLGGGSSNAAGVLFALNHVHGNLLSARQLHALGLAIGADVPFFLYGRPAWATGIGDELTPMDDLSPLDLVVVYPGLAVATGEIFQALNLGLTKSAKQHRNSSFTKKEYCFPRDLANDLENITLDRYPVVREVKQALTALGARGVLMSGSGSAVFGLFADREAARQARRAVITNHKWQAFAVKLLIDPHYLRIMTQ